jgi:hypothetical protein
VLGSAAIRNSRHGQLQWHVECHYVPLRSVCVAPPRKESAEAVPVNRNCRAQYLDHCTRVLAHNAQCVKSKQPMRPMREYLPRDKSRARNSMQNRLKIKGIQSEQPQSLSRPVFTGERNTWVLVCLTALFSIYDAVSTDIQTIIIAKRGENRRTRLQDLELKYFLKNCAYTVCNYIRMQTYA